MGNFARDESREAAFLNSDADQLDLVVEVVNAETGVQTLTGKAVTELTNGPFVAPALVTSGQLAAFLESELDQGATDLNGDGDTNDNILRVINRDGGELTVSTPPSDLDAATAPIVDVSAPRQTRPAQEFAEMEVE